MARSWQMQSRDERITLHISEQVLVEEVGEWRLVVEVQVQVQEGVMMGMQAREMAVGVNKIRI